VELENIQTQFKERDTRVEQTAKASKEALDAALQAAKEAVGEQNKSNSVSIAKSEATTLKQIDGLAGSITALATTLNDKIDDLKERLTVIEGRASGDIETRAAGRERSNDVLGWVFGAFGILTAIATAIGALAVWHH